MGKKVLNPELVPYKQNLLKSTDVLASINGHALYFGRNIDLPNDLTKILDENSQIRKELVTYKQDRLLQNTLLGRINGRDLFFGGELYISGSGGGADLVEKKGYNLYDYKLVQPDTSLSSSNGQTTTPADNYVTSGYISVKPNTQYTFKARRVVAWYGEDRTFISASPYSEESIKTLISPSNAAFCRFSFRPNSYEPDLMQMNEGDVLLNTSDAYSYLSVDDFFLKDYSPRKYGLEMSTIKLPAQGIADPTNLCLIATRCIWRNGKTPNYNGYLFLDLKTEKLYYSNNDPDHPVYLCDWDRELADNEDCDAFHATITNDGDIIFLRHYQRRNPIIYPHEDYNSPYIVDLGTRKKPYAFLMGSSCVQFEDGSIVWGDYVTHSLKAEQENDGRCIWRVTKPYNNPSNWNVAHEFKHVYYDSPQSDQPENEIGHIHAINYDWFNDITYCTTGDIDRHCRLWYSLDRGITWQAVPGAVGNVNNVRDTAKGQKWRFTNMIFMEEYVYWVTDSFYTHHAVWRCRRNSNNVVDASTLERMAYLEYYLPSGRSQATYASALINEPYGILIIDRAEPRTDGLLDVKFFSFDDNKVYIVKTLKRATTDASGLELSTRIGLPNQTTMMYQPENDTYIMCGGGTKLRTNNTSLFRNSLDNFVGALKLKVVKL